MHASSGFASSTGVFHPLTPVTGKPCNFRGAPEALKRCFRIESYVVCNWYLADRLIDGIAMIFWNKWIKVCLFGLFCLVAQRCFNISWHIFSNLCVRRQYIVQLRIHASTVIWWDTLNASAFIPRRKAVRQAPQILCHQCRRRPNMHAASSKIRSLENLAIPVATPCSFSTGHESKQSLPHEAFGRGEIWRWHPRCPGACDSTKPPTRKTIVRDGLVAVCHMFMLCTGWATSASG